MPIKPPPMANPPHTRAQLPEIVIALGAMALLASPAFAEDDDVEKLK
jgi:hypothetical protein